MRLTAIYGTKKRKPLVPSVKLQCFRSHFGSKQTQPHSLETLTVWLGPNFYWVQCLGLGGWGDLEVYTRGSG